MEIVADECCVVCLANSGDHHASKRNPKLGFLSGVKLFFAENLVKVGGVDTSLFEASLVIYWPHDLATPVNIGLTVLEAVVEVEESMANSVTMEEILHEELREDNIKGRFSIEIKGEHGLLQSEE